MAMKRGSKPEKVQEWKDRLERFQSSGQFVAEFCQVEGISQASLYRWQRRLSPRPQWGDNSSSAGSAFECIELLPGHPTTTIRLRSGIEIELGSDLRVIDLLLTRLFESPADSESRSC